MVSTGDMAPDFEAELEGHPFRLSDERGKHAVVLFFYPGDFTPVCTMEACHFRDNTPELQRRGAVVIGVSSDDAASHARFKAQHKLPYNLLSDPGRKIAEAYGLVRLGGMLGSAMPTKRVTVVVGLDGRVLGAVEAELDYRAHVDQALKLLADA